MSYKVDYPEIKVAAEGLISPHVGEALQAILPFSGQWYYTAQDGVAMYTRRVHLLQIKVERWPGVYEEMLADARKDLDWYQRMLSYWQSRHESMLTAAATWDQTPPPARGLLLKIAPGLPAQDRSRVD